MSKFNTDKKHANISLFVTHKGCPNMCSFCNQKTISGAIESITPKEVKSSLTDAENAGLKSLNTEIAFFGGSFTAIDRKYMLSLLEATKPFLDKGVFSGIRISTRPDAVNQEILNILKKYNVTAIELGAQSTDDVVLESNRRGHTKEDIFTASSLIKENGFSLGLQMMTGLYNSTREKDIKTAEDIISLSPDTVRIYPTIVLENTHLAELSANNKYSPETLEDAISLSSELLLMFHKADIEVIRLGLHSGGNVSDGYLSGPYHPAFGEKCESRIYFNLLKEKLKIKSTKTKIDNDRKLVTVYVPTNETSKVIGHKGENKKKLYDLGYIIKVKEKNSLNKYEIETEVI